MDLTHQIMDLYFLNVVEYNNTDPAIVKFELPATATNPGIAASTQNFATIIKFNDYPKFTTTQKLQNLELEKN